MLLKKYDVVLTDHQTRNERIISALKKFNSKNLNTGIDRMNHAIESFSKSMDQLSTEMDRMGAGRADHAERMWGKRKNTHIL